MSDTYLTATVPSGETGFVMVTTPSGELLSSKIFKVTPKLTSFAPPSGKVGDSILLAGTGLIQALNLAVGGVKVTSYIVNSDLKVTIRIPTGAKTGKIAVTTSGGSASTSATFTVTP
jgi:hypothetical protein